MWGTPGPAGALGATPMDESGAHDQPEAEKLASSSDDATAADMAGILEAGGGEPATAEGGGAEPMDAQEGS